jgi:hypothetical protein
MSTASAVELTVRLGNCLLRTWTLLELLSDFSHSFFMFTDHVTLHHIDCRPLVSTSGSNPERLQTVDLAVELWSLLLSVSLRVQFFNSQSARFTLFIVGGRPISAAAGK